MPLFIPVGFVFCAKRLLWTVLIMKKISCSRKKKGNSRNEDRKIRILESVFFNEFPCSKVSIFSSVQSLSRVQLFATPWTAACQASLSITNSQSLLKLMSIELVMPSNHLILCCLPFSCLQSFPASGSFQMSQLFASIGWNIGVSASASVFPMNIQSWFPLGWTGWISLKSKGLSRVFSNTKVQSINFSALNFLYSPTLISTHDHWKKHSVD